MAPLRVGAEDAELIRLLGDEVATQLLDELPPDQRDAVRAHVLDERTYGEIAGSLATSEATVRKRVSRGLQALRVRAGGDR